MHPRRRTPIWSRKPARAALVLAPIFLFGAAMAVVRKDAAHTPGVGSEALAPEERQSPAGTEPQRPTRKAVSDRAMSSSEQARVRALSASVELAIEKDLPGFAQRYLDWDAERMLAEAALLEQRAQTLAQARCALLLGTDEAEDDRGEAPAGVYARGDGKRYRLPESIHADLYGLRAETEWLRQRAESH